MEETLPSTSAPPRWIPLALIVGVVILLVLAWPRAGVAGTVGAPTGDPAVIESLQERREALRGALVQTSFTTDSAATASQGVAPEGAEQVQFEIGSISKVFTGMLLADAIDRGEVARDTTLGEAIPELAGTPAGGATLEQLATHTSGLPRLPEDAGFFWGATLAQVAAKNPYGQSLPELDRLAAATERGEPGTYAYSNLGVTLLGHAIANRAGADYPTLLRERITGPLGMTDTVVGTAEMGRGDLIRGYTATGRPAEDWGGETWAPSGAIRSTTADLTRFGQAILRGEAPGMAALEPSPIADPEHPTGLNWHLDEAVAEHNGMTGGYASYLAVDRDRGIGMVVLHAMAVDPSPEEL